MKRLLGTVALVALVLPWVQARPSEEEKIDAVVAAVVEAYRSGDYEAMGRYYADDVTMVPASYAPPVTGWRRVAEQYKAAYAHLTGAEMLRENTLIRREDDLAWAVYQWRFAGVMGTQTYSVMGHTTLILEKRKGNWKIVHNHTSALPIRQPPKQEEAEAQPADQPPS